MNGVFKARGFQTVQYQMPQSVLTTVDIPIAAEPVAEHKCTGTFDHEIGQWTCGNSEYHAGQPIPAPPAPVVPEPVPEPVAPEPVPEPVVEAPAISEVEAPAEVLEAAPESGLVPEDPPA